MICISCKHRDSPQQAGLPTLEAETPACTCAATPQRLARTSSLHLLLLTHIYTHMRRLSAGRLAHIHTYAGTQYSFFHCFVFSHTYAGTHYSSFVSLLSFFTNAGTLHSRQATLIQRRRRPLKKDKQMPLENPASVRP